MKRSKLSPVFFVGAMCAAFGSTAVASDKWLGDRGDNWEEHIVSTKARAQVIAELNDARAKGLLPDNGEAASYPVEQTSASGAGIVRKTRAQVIAELNEAREQGLLPGNGEIPTYPDPEGMASRR